MNETNEMIQESVRTHQHGRVSQPNPLSASDTRTNASLGHTFHVPDPTVRLNGNKNPLCYVSELDCFCLVGGNQGEKEIERCCEAGKPLNRQTEIAVMSFN